MPNSADSEDKKAYSALMRKLDTFVPEKGDEEFQNALDQVSDLVDLLDETETPLGDAKVSRRRISK